MTMNPILVAILAFAAFVLASLCGETARFAAKSKLAYAAAIFTAMPFALAALLLLAQSPAPDPPCAVFLLCLLPFAATALLVGGGPILKTSSLALALASAGGMVWQLVRGQATLPLDPDYAAKLVGAFFANLATALKRDLPSAAAALAVAAIFVAALALFLPVPRRQRSDSTEVVPTAKAAARIAVVSLAALLLAIPLLCGPRLAPVHFLPVVLVAALAAGAACAEGATARRRQPLVFVAAAILLLAVAAKAPKSNAVSPRDFDKTREAPLPFAPTTDERAALRDQLSRNGVLSLVVAVDRTPAAIQAFFQDLSQSGILFPALEEKLFGAAVPVDSRTAVLATDAGAASLERAIGGLGLSFRKLHAPGFGWLFLANANQENDADNTPSSGLFLVGEEFFAEPDDAAIGRRLAQAKVPDIALFEQIASIAPARTVFLGFLIGNSDAEASQIVAVRIRDTTEPALGHVVKFGDALEWLGSRVLSTERTSAQTVFTTRHYWRAGAEARSILKSARVSLRLSGNSGRTIEDGFNFSFHGSARDPAIPSGGAACVTSYSSALDAARFYVDHAIAIPNGPGHETWTLSLGVEDTARLGTPLRAFSETIDIDGRRALVDGFLQTQPADATPRTEDSPK